MIKRANDERDVDHDREVEVRCRYWQRMRRRIAAEWEEFLRERHVPAPRVRSIGEALADPQLESLALPHQLHSAPGIPGAFTVPATAFKFGHGGPRVDWPRPLFGQHNEEVLTELGYSPSDIAGFQSAKII
jgi:crotonobetainyl-CoA:carnitine CoA-transferase CaiB-like acyl-CoA transferase